MRLTFDNKYWTVRFKKLPNDALWGESDHEKQIITLSPSMQDESWDLLHTAVHEFMHAEYPYMEEEKIERAGYNMARALWRMGARIVLGEAENDD